MKKIYASKNLESLARGANSPPTFTHRSTFDFVNACPFVEIHSAFLSFNDLIFMAALHGGVLEYSSTRYKQKYGIILRLSVYPVISRSTIIACSAPATISCAPILRHLTRKPSSATSCPRSTAPTPRSTGTEMMPFTRLPRPRPPRRPL